MDCKVCGYVDDYYDENADVDHEATPKHLCNVILRNYQDNKKFFSKNRDGLFVICHAKSEEYHDAEVKTIDNCDHHKVRLYVKPNQGAQFSFNIKNDMNNDDVLIVGVQLAHPQPQFKMEENPYVFGNDPHLLKKKSSIPEDIKVKFKVANIGQYEMPVMFTFHKESENRNIIIIREMVVNVQENPVNYMKVKNYYCNEEWEHADHYIPSTNGMTSQVRFKVPALLKILLPRGIDNDALEGLKVPPEIMQKLQVVLMSTRQILEEGITKENYMKYFHHLLWWEEVIQRINLRKYNMSGVTLEKIQKETGVLYILEVPGLAEKRPSLLRGDRVIIRPCAKTSVLFESTIKDIDECHVYLANIDPSFNEYYAEGATYDIRFLLSRVPMERMHEAIYNAFSSKQESRIFPEPNKQKVKRANITKWLNPLIRDNPEQRCAVEHIAAGSSGLAPYIVFGPPGTGKTMTIVEGILQLVMKNPRNRILVCTESNMAADHIAVMLLKYTKELKINNLLLRANSQSREWSVMPAELASVSNGTSYDNFYSVSNVYVASYRIVVTTLMHAAKYAMQRSQASHRLQMSHVFVDEAAQASEPAALVPVAGLLAPAGCLVLAGDPQQLGPVFISKEARDRGLGMSLMERLRTTFTDMYDKNPAYITMLVKNFRSHPDILALPNQLFYDNKLEACAEEDPLSTVSILGLPGGKRAIVFHGVNSREQRMGNAPSFFNEKELDLLKQYVKALISKHNVQEKDIGIISPYIRQVYKMKMWLSEQQLSDIEIGTVEAFQGKEKRVVLVSTVRANCRLLDYDAKYGLGFLVDDKRYNVTLTRAKAKLIIIGNPTCLIRDKKWRMYMDKCEEFDCYHGYESQQLERNSALLIEVARTRFEKCRLLEAINKALTEKEQKKSKGKK